MRPPWTFYVARVWLAVFLVLIGLGVLAVLFLAARDAWRGDPIPLVCVLLIFAVAFTMLAYAHWLEHKDADEEHRKAARR